MGLFSTHIRTMQYIGNNPYDLNRNKAMHNATLQLFCNWKNYTFIPSATRAKIWYQQNAFKPPVAWAAVRSKAVVLLLFIRC